MEVGMVAERKRFGWVRDLAEWRVCQRVEMVENGCGEARSASRLRIVDRGCRRGTTGSQRSYAQERREAKDGRQWARRPSTGEALGPLARK
jgi:hypothetical protein